MYVHEQLFTTPHPEANIFPITKHRDIGNMTRPTSNKWSVTERQKIVNLRYSEILKLPQEIHYSINYFKENNNTKLKELKHLIGSKEQYFSKYISTKAKRQYYNKT